MDQAVEIMKWVAAASGMIAAFMVSLDNGRRVTGFFAIRDDVENAGGVWEDAPCVRDGDSMEVQAVGVLRSSDHV